MQPVSSEGGTGSKRKRDVVLLKYLDYVNKEAILPQNYRLVNHSKERKAGWGAAEAWDASLRSLQKPLMELQPRNSLEPALSCSLASALAQGPPGRPIWVPVTRGLCEEMVRGLARSLAARPPCPGFCGAVSEQAAKKWRPGGKQSCRTKQQMEDILWVSLGFRAGKRIS